MGSEARGEGNFNHMITIKRFDIFKINSVYETHCHKTNSKIGLAILSDK